MYQFVLANLLADNDDVLAALFLDGTGETVDLASAGSNHYDLRILGAYLGIYLRRIEKIFVAYDLGHPRIVHIEKRGAHIYAVPLAEGYFLALIQRHPALVARARATLEDAAEQLKAELFPESLPR
jgi:hypothetical protein